ncbi:MAG: ABC transporter permease, partial [Halobacteriaceae archaeon]
MRWGTVVALMLLVEIGAVLHYFATLLVDFLKAAPGKGTPTILREFSDLTAKIPTLLSRNHIPNRGHWNGNEWVGTWSMPDPILQPIFEMVGMQYTGISPAIAWSARLILVYIYAFVWLFVLWDGYRRFRRYYRAADWTPRDDVIDRLRTHRWGQFGFIIVFLFVVMAVFAPTLGPTTVDQNISNPYSHKMKYWSDESNSVKTILVGAANRNTRSVGSQNVGPMTYDKYGRWHPFGTLSTGKDLFTFIVAGSRISLIIGLLAVGLSSIIAVAFGLISAYYKGKVDLGFVLASDAVMAMPQLLLLIMLTVVLSGTWLANIYSGALLLALIFAATGWPFMWRSIRGPALQVSEREWIDAAKSFGQTPGAIMRKHMFPYIVGYLLIYGSMTLGGAIIAIAGLSFLGLGVNPPT